ncbi:MAG: stalk domain-containing protein [Clostridia bacterium]|nr:stalk domain-containing protein [Clostridia bacterium]
MKRFIAFLLSNFMAFTMLYAIPVYAENEISLFVSPFGDDKNEGTIDLPLATLEGARDKIRQMKSDNKLSGREVTVYFRDGIYDITDTVEFTEQDSGTDESPIVYKAYMNETPIFSGGVAIDSSSFILPDKEITDRLPTVKAKKYVRAVNLKENGIDDITAISNFGYCGGTPPKMIYFGDTAGELGRYPNKTENNENVYLKTGIVKKAGDSVYDKPTDSKNEEKVNPEGAVFSYSDERIDRWSKNKDIMAFGYWYVEWAEDNNIVADIDTENKLITLNGTTVYGVKSDSAYYFYNILDEIDTAGEYYIDSENSILYFYPTEGDNTVIYYPTLTKEYMITLENVSNVVFEGLTFGVTEKSVMSMKKGENNIVKNCSFKNIGKDGIDIGQGTVYRAGRYEKTDKNFGVIGCDFINIGYTGVKVTAGDRESLERADHYIEDCLFYNWGMIKKTYQPAVSLSGVGLRVSNCEMSCAPHSAVLYRGNEITIENNDIYNVCIESQDCGAIYSGRDVTCTGNSIRNNYIHDISNSSGPGKVSADGYKGKMAIYCDDNLAWCNIEGNIIQNVPAGIAMGWIQNRVNNNIFYDVISPVGAGYNTNEFSWGYGVDADTFMKYSFAADLSQLPVENEYWKNKYPQIAEMKNMNNSAEYYKIDVCNNAVVYNSIEDKLNNGLGLNKEGVERSASKVENNAVYNKDPGFVDAASGNFTIIQDSLIKKDIPEFKEIDTAKIGLKNQRGGYKESFVRKTADNSTFSTDTSMNMGIKQYSGSAEYITLNNALADMDNWSAQDVEKTETGGYKREAHFVKSEPSITMAYDRKYLNEIIQFNVSADFSDSNNWLGFILRAATPDKISWFGNSGYLIVIKDTGIELQRWGRTGGSKVLTLVKNIYIKPNEMTALQLAAINVDKGVLITMSANGRRVFSYLDNDEQRIEDEGFFAIENYCDVNIEPVFEDLGKNPIPFNAAISGYALTGETISASFSAINDDGSLTTEWYKSSKKPVYAEDLNGAVAPPEEVWEFAEKIDGADGNTYQIRNEDIGKYLYAVVRSENGDRLFSRYMYIDPMKQNLAGNIIMAVDTQRAIVDGNVKEIDRDCIFVTPLEYDGAVYLPVRFICECLNLQVSWDENEKTALITDGVQSCLLAPQNDYMLYKNENTKLVFPVFIENDRLYLSLKDAEKIFNKTITYDSNGLIVISDDEQNISSEVSKTIVSYLSQIYDSLKID